MSDVEDINDDIFADLYDPQSSSPNDGAGHDASNLMKNVNSSSLKSTPVNLANTSGNGSGTSSSGSASISSNIVAISAGTDGSYSSQCGVISTSSSNKVIAGGNGNGSSTISHSLSTLNPQSSAASGPGENEAGGTSQPIGIKEDGKMFIGGLNWETTEKSLKDYFSQFGQVLECTVMRDGPTGRSRGFGFLTFKDPKTVNIVMVKEHYLDGKIIDPKRAIPREEQDRTSKIFVGGVSQDASEHIFKTFFQQFGRVIDATLMIDKDTGRPRGFGFVTFDGEEAVDQCLSRPLEILGKPIEVKRAEPRAALRDEDKNGAKFYRRQPYNRSGYDGNNNMPFPLPGTNTPSLNNGGGTGAGGSSMNSSFEGNGSGSQHHDMSSMQNMSGMTPAMIAQYWQKIQQYFAMMQQQMAVSMAAQQQQHQQHGFASQNMPGAMMPGAMNSMMVQQMLAMQQATAASGGGQGNGGGGGGGGGPGNMNMNGHSMGPAMMMNMMHPMMMQQNAMNGGGGGSRTVGGNGMYEPSDTGSRNMMSGGDCRNDVISQNNRLNVSEELRAPSGGNTKPTVTTMVASSTLVSAPGNVNNNISTNRTTGNGNGGTIKSVGSSNHGSGGNGNNLANQSLPTKNSHRNHVHPHDSKHSATTTLPTNAAIHNENTGSVYSHSSASGSGSGGDGDGGGGGVYRGSKREHRGYHPYTRS